MSLIHKDFSMLTGLPPNQPTTFKVINVHNLNNFQSIWLKLGMQTQNEKTRCMYATKAAYLSTTLLTTPFDNTV